MKKNRTHGSGFIKQKAGSWNAVYIFYMYQEYYGQKLRDRQLKIDFAKPCNCFNSDFQDMNDWCILKLEQCYSCERGPY